MIRDRKTRHSQKVISQWFPHSLQRIIKAHGLAPALGFNWKKSLCPPRFVFKWANSPLGTCNCHTPHSHPAEMAPKGASFMAPLPAAYHPASEFLCAQRNPYPTLQYHPREHFQWVSEFPIISFLKQQKSQLFPGVCAMAQRRALLLPFSPQIFSHKIAVHPSAPSLVYGGFPRVAGIPVPVTRISSSHSLLPREIGSWAFFQAFLSGQLLAHLTYFPKAQDRGHRKALKHSGCCAVSQLQNLPAKQITTF